MTKCIATPKREKVERRQFNARLPLAIINHIIARAEANKCSQGDVIANWAACDMARQVVGEMVKKDE